jgi:hypothetical protein
VSVTIQTWGGVTRIDKALHRGLGGRRLWWPILIRTLFYVGAAAAVMLGLVLFPPTGALLDHVALIPKVAAPIVVGMLASRTRVDDRTLHVLAVDYVTVYRSRPRLSSAGVAVKRGGVKA